MAPFSARQRLEAPQHGDEEEAAHQNGGAESADDYARVLQTHLDLWLVWLIEFFRM
jgi:hypothetical protein